MTTFPKKLDVTIMGSTYSLKSDEPETTVRQMAAEVDERMRAVSRSQPNLGTGRIAVLVAMQLVGEMQQLKRENARLQKLVTERKAPVLRESKEQEPGIEGAKVSADGEQTPKGQTESFHPSRWRFEKKIYPLEGEGERFG